MFDVVVLIATPDIALCEYNFLFSYVSHEKQERVKRFHDFQNARNCLLSDILVRIEICRVMGLSNKQLEFVTSSYGKPYLANNLPVYYNISHAGQYIACVIADELVGIDIELVKPIDMKVAERFFSHNETTYILSAPDDDIRVQRFFEIWTKKESRLKWEGKGLTKDLRSFSVLDIFSKPTVFYHQVYSSENAVCHVCSSKREAPTIRIIDTYTLLRDVYLLNRAE